MIEGINHITISVKSIDSAFSFYKDILGLKPIMKSRRSAYFLAGSQWIALNLEENWEQSEMYAHICFASSHSTYDIIVKNLRKKGVREWQENGTEGNSIYFLDDSGNK